MNPFSLAIEAALKNNKLTAKKYLMEVENMSEQEADKALEDAAKAATISEGN